jgi:hypothetical protein
MTCGELGGFAPVGTDFHITLWGATLSESLKVMVVPDATVSVAGVKLSAVLLPTPCGMSTVAVPPLEVEGAEVLEATVVLVVELGAVVVVLLDVVVAAVVVALDVELPDVEGADDVLVTLELLLEVEVVARVVVEEEDAVTVGLPAPLVVHHIVVHVDDAADELEVTVVAEEVDKVVVEAVVLLVVDEEVVIGVVDVVVLLDVDEEVDEVVIGVVDADVVLLDEVEVVERVVIGVVDVIVLLDVEEEVDKVVIDVVVEADVVLLDVEEEVERVVEGVVEVADELELLDVEEEVVIGVVDVVVLLDVEEEVDKVVVEAVVLLEEEVVVVVVVVCIWNSIFSDMRLLSIVVPSAAMTCGELRAMVTSQIFPWPSATPLRAAPMLAHIEVVAYDCGARREVEG